MNRCKPRQDSDLPSGSRRKGLIRFHEMGAFSMVKRIIQIQLRPTPDQAAALEATGRFHQACNWVAQRAFEHKLANRYALHKRYYYAVRQQCAECGHVERANRCSQSEFCCRRCGLKVHADVNAARTDHPSQESVSTRP